MSGLSLHRVTEVNADMFTPNNAGCVKIEVFAENQRFPTEITLSFSGNSREARGKAAIFHDG